VEGLFLNFIYSDMKYLRVFEGFVGDYYQKVDNEEYWDNLAERLEMSSNLIDKIRKLFPGCEVYLIPFFELESDLDYITSDGDLCIKIKDFMTIRLYEVDDEYFYVNVNDESYYKCDQFEGLVKLLVDKNIIRR